MNTFSNWMPSIFTFAVAFVTASLLSGVSYWLARRPSTAMLWVRRVFSAIASVAMLLIFVAMLASIEPLSAFGALLVVVVASGLQTLIEANIDGGSLEKKHQFARSFFTYLCSASLIWLALVVLASIIARSSSASSVLSWDIMAGVWGLVAGLVLAPLSISFCRWMFQSLHLRPGIDRTLREEELVR